MDLSSRLMAAKIYSYTSPNSKKRVFAACTRVSASVTNRMMTGDALPPAISFCSKLTHTLYSGSIFSGVLITNRRTFRRFFFSKKFMLLILLYVVLLFRRKCLKLFARCSYFLRNVAQHKMHN